MKFGSGISKHFENILLGLVVILAIPTFYSFSKNKKEEKTYNIIR